VRLRVKQQPRLKVIDQFRERLAQVSRQVAGGGREQWQVLDEALVGVVGTQIDPADLGPRPANVSVERYVPQAQVLPFSDLVVFHGGSGTLTGALAYGLPLVLLAMGADQLADASRCDALGLGLSLDPMRVTPEVVREGIASVLADDRFRRASQRFRVEIASQPAPATSVALLERLAIERQPIEAGTADG